MARSQSQKQADKKYESKRAKLQQGKCFAAIVYPESANPDWIAKLQKYLVHVFISPLHDKDVYLEDTEDHKAGEIKKPHYHVLIEYPKVMRETTPQSMFDNACGEGSTKVIKINDEVNALKYFWHENNPEKYQYSKDDVVCLSGANVDDLIMKNGLSKSDERRISKEIVAYIIKTSEVDFIDLLEYCIDAGKEDWYEYINTHTSFITACLRSMEYKTKQCTL